MGCFGTDKETQEQRINYTPEAEAARKNLWQTLSEWGSSGTYGAVDMNWEDIFKSAEKKINQYYWGGPGDTGLAGKVKASAARRGASQSPALENTLATLGMRESSDISDLITGLTTQKASYTESARKNWLASLLGLSGFKSGATNITETDDSGLSDIIGKLTSGGLSLLTGGKDEEEDEESKDDGLGDTLKTVMSIAQLAAMFA